MKTAQWRAFLPFAGQGAAMSMLVIAAVALYRWHGIDAPRIDVAPARVAMAVIAVLAYAAFCALFLLRAARRSAANRVASLAPGEMLVIHASQTGTAEGLAARTADSLRAGGVAVRCLPLGLLDAATLSKASRALFLVSTTGEGDAPDDAYRFVRDTMADAASLPNLRYGMLALGDGAYETFCGFGRTLDHWLRERAAAPLFDTVEVDDGDEGALRHWQHHLAQIGGRGEASDWSAPAYERWRLAQRRVLNAGSPGAAAVWIRMEPISTPGAWQAGDIVEVLPGPPGSDHPHREYSVASLPSDGSIELLVRQMRHPDGSPGLGSGWLTQVSRIGDEISLRTRRNASFHAPDDARPLILVGNGTGIAGLRAHLKQRIAQGWHRNWLLFGERTRAHDLHFGDELETWLARGSLEHLDLAFSRDGSGRRYVQDLIAQTADTLRAWIADGASIYVCGSLRGMAPGVDAALTDVLGAEGLERLRIEGRYRRDVY